MRRPLVAGNWKMHGSRRRVRELVQHVCVGVGSGGRARVAIFPPFVYLPDAAAVLSGEVMLGAQDVCAEVSGAYTGEVSATMLLDVGCTYVIVGHSERRALYGEDDAAVARKFFAARHAGLIPILCVGETLAEREQGITQQVVTRQLDAVLEASSAVDALAGTVIAYEPVWAIGTGRTASPEQAQEVHALIRQRIARHDMATAERLQILYGGSVKAVNARELFDMPDIDGGLVGGASLDAAEFVEIYRSAEAKG